MEITSNVPDAITVSWALTSNCNYACWYCHPTFHDNKNGFPDYDKAIEFVKTLKQQHPSLIFIELIGGEPSLWPRLIDFCIEVSNLGNIFLQIGTNLSRTPRYWKDFTKQNLENNVLLEVSHHAELSDDDIFIENLRILSQKHYVNVSFMLDIEHCEKSINLFNKIKKENIKISGRFKPLRSIDGHNDGNFAQKYTDYHYNIIKNLKLNLSNDINVPELPDKIFYIDNNIKTNVDLPSLIVDKKNSYLGWKCAAGSKRFVIESNGNIMPCGFVHKSLGNINQGNFKILNDYITCTINYCNCLYDVNTHKFL